MKENLLFETRVCQSKRFFYFLDSCILREKIVFPLTHGLWDPREAPGKGSPRVQRPPTPWIRPRGRGKFSDWQPLIVLKLVSLLTSNELFKINFVNPSEPKNNIFWQTFGEIGQEFSKLKYCFCLPYSAL